MAKRFRFRLDALLSIRQLREREAMRKVGAQRAAIAQIERLDAEAAEQIERQYALLRGEQSAWCVSPGELARGRAWVAHLRRMAIERQREKQDLEKELAGFLDELREARRQTKIIEKLRERRWEEYRLNLRREQQAGMDEVARQLHAMRHDPSGNPVMEVDG